jgi:hypothetical protein
MCCAGRVERKEWQISTWFLWLVAISWQLATLLQQTDLRTWHESMYVFELFSLAERGGFEPPVEV